MSCGSAGAVTRFKGGSSPGSKILSREKNVITQSGDIADLGGKTLAYTSNDGAMPAGTRKAIEDWEKKRGKSKIEFAFLVDENGNVIAENRGGRGSVKTSVLDKMKSDTLTHIHPRGKGEEGYIGGTFSRGDLVNFANNTNGEPYGVISKLRSYRAKAAEGTYFISKSDKFDRQGFKSFVSGLETDFNTSLREKNNKADADYRAGNTDYKTYLSTRKRNFNVVLVERHNALLGAQKKYGYIYGLERN